MRLPWVSREQYEQQVAMTEHYRAGNVTILGWYNDLLQKYHALANPPLPLASAPVPAPEKKDSVIAKAIRGESNGDSRLSAHLWKRSRELRVEHPDWEDSQIGEELTKWDSTFVESAAP